MTDLYHYDPKNQNKFLGITEANIDPIDGNPLVPAFSTLTAPPSLSSSQEAIWNDIDQEWDVYQHVYAVNGGYPALIIISEISPNYEESAPPESPEPGLNQQYNFVGDEWILQYNISVDEHRDLRKNELFQKSTSAKFGGFSITSTLGFDISPSVLEYSYINAKLDNHTSSSDDIDYIDVNKQARVLDYNQMETLKSEISFFLEVLATKQKNHIVTLNEATTHIEIDAVDFSDLETV